MQQAHDHALTAEERQSIKVGPLLAVLLSGALVAILNETLLNVAITPIMQAPNGSRLATYSLLPF